MKTKKRIKQRKKNYTKELFDSIWPFAAVIAGVFALALLERLLPPEADAWLTAAVKAVISAVLLVLLVFRWGPAKMPLPGILTVIAAVLLLWMYLLPDHIEVLAKVFLIAAGCVLAVIAQCRRVGFGREYAIMISFFALAVLQLTSGIEFQSGAQFPYWLPALIAAALCSGLIAVLMGKDLLHLEDERTSECVCLVILAAAAAFVIVQYSAVGLNYALDTSAPETYTVQITDKDTSSTRGSTTYYLTADSPDGELEFTVPGHTYRTVEEGDSVSLLLYDGAFGDPYYLLQTSGKEN